MTGPFSAEKVAVAVTPNQEQNSEQDPRLANLDTMSFADVLLLELTLTQEIIQNSNQITHNIMSELKKNPQLQQVRQRRRELQAQQAQPTSKNTDTFAEAA